MRELRKRSQEEHEKLRQIWSGLSKEMRDEYNKKMQDIISKHMNETQKTIKQLEETKKCSIGLDGPKPSEIEKLDKQCDSEFDKLIDAILATHQ